MIKKHKQTDSGPSWLEVGIAACLGVLVGVVFGVAYLVVKPVSVVKEIPKDAPSGAIYYFEGTRDFYKSMLVDEKRKEFTEGRSVSLDEGELNAFLVGLKPSAAPTPAAKPGGKAPPPPEPKAFDTGTPNVRIRGGKIQIANTVTYNIEGIIGSIIVQANGTLSKRGGTVVFDPEVFYVGGCPIQRFPFIKDYLISKLILTIPIPEDLASAWSKLSDISVEGSELRLTMP